VDTQKNTVTATVTVPEPSRTATFTPAPTLTITAQATRSRTATQTRVRALTPTATRALPTPLAWDSRLDTLGIKLIPANVQVGEQYWRLVKAEFWDEKQNQGKHHIFVDVLDAQGARIIGHEILVEWPNDRLIIVTEDKPAPEYSANFPLDISHYPPFATLGAFTVSVNGLPSDRVSGMGLPPRNIFVVYLLTFQRTLRR
jgi:hypothetical protein